MSNDKNNDKKDKDNVGELVDYYLNNTDKGDAIQDLATKYSITERRVYQILKERGIATPNKFKKNEIKLLNDNNVELTDTILISEKLKEYGYKDKTQRERRVNLVNYIQKTTGIDVIDAIDNILIKMIADIETEQLTSDIANIKKGNYDIFETRKNLKNEMEGMLLNIAKDSIQENFSPEQLIPQKPPKTQPFISEELMEIFLALKNPMLYRQLKIMKGEADPLQTFMKNLAKTTNKIKPPKLLVKTSPKKIPRKKNKIIEKKI